MSFGSSIGDCILLAQLAWNTYQGARKACGEHDELTREVSSLYKVLNRLRKEVSNPESQLNKASNDKRQELEEHVAGCEGILKTMHNVLTKYNALTGEQKRGRRLWQKIKFGNGQTKDLAEIRIKLSTHTSAIMMSLKLCSLDSMGRVETALGRVEARSAMHGEQLHGIRKALHWVTANMTAVSREGSVWTSYTNDDQMFWRELRRELAKEGYRSSTLQRHKRLITNYVEELGNRGVFDDILDLEEDSNEGNINPDDNSLVESPPVSEASDVKSSPDSHNAPYMEHTIGQSGSGSNAVDIEPQAVVSEQPFDENESSKDPSGDHDGSYQRMHASCTSHTDGDIAGQDENHNSDIPPMTTSDGEAVAVSEKVSLDFETIENTDPVMVLDEECLCVSTLDDFAGDESRTEIVPADAPRVSETAPVETISSIVPPATLEDFDSLKDISPRDILLETESYNQMTSASGSDIDAQVNQTGRDGKSPIRSVSSPPTLTKKLSVVETEILVEEHIPADASDNHSFHAPLVVPLDPSGKIRSPYAVQIEEVLDEEFKRHTGSGELEEWHTKIPSREDSQSSVVPHDAAVSEDTSEDKSINTWEEVPADEAAGAVRSEHPPPVSVEEVLDEDFSVDAHPNVSTTNATFDYHSDTGATLAWRDSAEPLAGSPTREETSSKRVRFANAQSAGQTSDLSETSWAPEDLRFIFYRETRDFNSYRELQESYQALFDEAGGGYNRVDSNRPENTTTFITHSPYTPPATIYDLQYYRVPASYFHTFWHPQRVPIYLHGNVFDGISLTNWIYNWTTYTFRDSSYHMNAVQRFGTTVVKLGSALSDIEHAKPSVKANLPKDLYDESGALWADLENILNDIMSEAEDRLEASKKGGRLEVYFVNQFCHELISGKRFYQQIDRFLKKTEAWCKKARFHPDFIMLWELWES